MKIFNCYAMKPHSQRHFSSQQILKSEAEVLKYKDIKKIPKIIKISLLELIKDWYQINAMLDDVVK